MRKIFATILLCAGLSVAQAAPNVFNHLGIGAAVGTNGLSFEVATPITGFVNMRAGVSYMQGNRIKKRGRLTTLELPGSWYTCIFKHRCSCMSIAL